jgi:hypothetical protein
VTPGPAGGAARPREVTLGGAQAVVGGALATLLLIGAAKQLYSSQMHDALAKAVADPRAKDLGLSIADARTLAKYTIMVMGVLSVSSVVLGIFVLRRHRPSRLALTVIGGLVAVMTLFAGPAGWIVTVYIAASVAMLWSRPARAWFARPPTSPGQLPPSSSGPFVPPPG